MSYRLAHVVGGGPIDGAERVPGACAELRVNVDVGVDAELATTTPEAQVGQVVHRYVYDGRCRGCGRPVFRYDGEATD